MITTIAFDVFGTVLDMNAPKEEMKDYARQIEEGIQLWKPLKLPASWLNFKAHSDSKVGLELLRKKYKVVTCSNAPLWFLSEVSKRNELVWDAIIPLETYKVYKPNPMAYLAVCELMRIKPEEVLMVTANNKPSKYFRDLEAAQEVGMKSILIRHDIPSIVALAALLDPTEENLKVCKEFHNGYDPS